MTQHVTPMLHVPDVRATAAWYESIGFTILRTNEDDGEMNWALLSLDGSEIMLDAGGHASAAFRREVDLYIGVRSVAERRASLPANTDVIEDVHDTFYGMRELIIRDVNRFWLTFGEPL